MMRTRIQWAVMMGFLIAAGVGAGACLPQPGIACGDGWCSEGYRCVSVDLASACVKNTCGDGIVDRDVDDEECDDGNDADIDDCLQTCKLNTCGDGQVNLRTEECDDGNDTNGDGCDNNCTRPGCGNGVKTGTERCDDGNNYNNDGCDNECTASTLVYLKASTTGALDQFGDGVALSADGLTLAVGARSENSNATGIDNPDLNNSARNSGAVYVFTLAGGVWRQQAYIKASNTGINDQFGYSVALSDNGSTLAVGAPGEDGTDILVPDSGAVYVFTRSDVTWSQQAYLKASNPGALDQLGVSVALSHDGLTLAVGAPGEDGAATGIGGLVDELAMDSGAVYVFMRSAGAGGVWSQPEYIKASDTGAVDQFGISVALSAHAADDGWTLAVGAPTQEEDEPSSATNSGAVYVFEYDGTLWSPPEYLKAATPGPSDQFGVSVALSHDGSILAVGASFEDSAATGTGGDQDDNAATDSGAVYVFTDDGTTWSQQAYLKASNTGVYDLFGHGVALSHDGSILAVGARLEDSAATSTGGDPADNSAEDAGAVYVFTGSGTAWSQQAYLKASNTDAFDRFGFSVALSGDGLIRAVGAIGEASAAAGIGSDQRNNVAEDAGAVYVFDERP